MTEFKYIKSSLVIDLFAQSLLKAYSENKKLKVNITFRILSQ